MTVTRPGVQVDIGQSVQPPVPPSDTGTVFVIGVTSQGPTDRAVLCLNIDEVTATFGDRIPAGSTVPTSPLWDWCDVAFKKGVQRIYVGRIAGPAAAPATATFDDADAAPSITVQSNGPGPSTLQVGIIEGTLPDHVAIQVLDADDNLLDQSPNLSSVADAVAWATYESKGLVKVIAAGAALPDVAAPTSLTGGSDDHASVTDTIRIAALPRLFPKQLGPGQMASAGSTTAVMNAGLSDFCKVLGNRVCLLDGPDSSNKTTIKTAFNSWRAACAEPLSETYALYSSPWRVVPGNVGQFARTVQPSAIIAGLIAVSDGKFGNPNLAAAGANGIDDYSLGSSQPEWSDADRTDLNSTGITCFANIYDEQRMYGFRSGAYAKDVNAASYAWVSFAAARLRMALDNELDIIGQEFLFDQLDGQGKTIAEYNGAITGKLLQYWGLGALYGATATDAFAVDTGPSVNTPTTIENQELHAKIGLKTSPFNELSYFEVTKVRLTEVLAA